MQSMKRTLEDTLASTDTKANIIVFFEHPKQGFDNFAPTLMQTMASAMEFIEKLSKKGHSVEIYYTILIGLTKVCLHSG